MGKDIVEKGPGVGRAAKKCGQPTILCPQKFWDFSQNSFINYSIHSSPDFINLERKI
jgi:hypothetical protein